MEDLKKALGEINNAKKAISAALSDARTQVKSGMSDKEVSAFNDFEKRYNKAVSNGDYFQAGEIAKEFKEKHG